MMVEGNQVYRLESHLYVRGTVYRFEKVGKTLRGTAVIVLIYPPIKVQTTRANHADYVVYLI